MTQKQAIDKLHEMKHWKNVYYRGLGKHVDISNASFEEKTGQCSVVLSYEDTAGNPVKKRLNRDFSTLDLMVSDFTFEDNIEVVKIEQVIPPSLPSPPIVVVEEKSGIVMLRDSLFKTIDYLQSGEITAENAKAVAIVAQTVINSVQLEMNYKLQCDETHEIKLMK